MSGGRARSCCSERDRHGSASLDLSNKENRGRFTIIKETLADQQDSIPSVPHGERTSSPLKQSWGGGERLVKETRIRGCKAPLTGELNQMRLEVLCA